jgi:hypothetical protein
MQRWLELDYQHHPAMLAMRFETGQEYSPVGRRLFAIRSLHSMIRRFG